MLLKKLFALLLVWLAAARRVVRAGRLFPHWRTHPLFPKTTEEGFLPEGVSPYYFKDHAAGYWFYLDQTVRIEIMRAPNVFAQADLLHGGHHVR